MSIPSTMYTVVATTGVAGAGAVNIDPTIVGDIGRWPVTIALVVLAALCVWLMHKNALRAADSMDKSSDRIDKLADSMLRMANELHERPCVRSKDNG